MRSRDGITDATEETIQREIKAIKEREAAKRKDQEVTTPTIAAGSKEDPAAAAQKYADEVQKISQEARVQMARNRELDAQDAARKAREVAKAKKDAEIEAMGEKVDAADEKMRRLSSTENAMPQADILRRIGGGFANSNYGQLSREAMLISKQVDYASKQLDELKKIVTELRKSDPLGGITT